MFLMPKTKIIATIGPSSDSEEMMEKLVKAGVSGLRFNMKHNHLDWHRVRIQRVRRIAASLKKPVAIIMDIQGPEVRVSYLPGKKIILKTKEKVFFVHAYQESEEKTITIDSRKLLNSLKKDDKLLLDNGRLIFRVLEKKAGKVKAEVLRGGGLEERRGVNFPEVAVDLPTLKKTDRENLKLAAELDIDFVALSFVRSKKDILILKEELRKLKLSAGVIAKIETKRAIEDFKEIIKVSDGVMVARGDLAIELAFEKVPYFQKEIIRVARSLGKPVIVATEMLESMIKNPQPTRAEVSDVANAVYDSADAMMLSAESASGQYPVEAVETMQRIAAFIEEKRLSDALPIKETDDITEAMVVAAWRLSQSDYARGEKVKAFVVLTDTGRTTRLLSRYRPTLPILALTNDKKVCNQLTLSFGTSCFYLRFPEGTIHSARKVIRFLKEKKALKKGEKVILIHGESWGTIGRTNTVRVQEVY